MRIRCSINNQFSDKIYLGYKLLCLFMVVYVMNTGIDHRRIKLLLLISGLFLIIVFVRKIMQPILWYAFLTILIFDLIAGYFVRANHHFLLIYVNLVLIIFLHNSNDELLIKNLKLILAIVLFFSAIQKLMSPQFVSGDFYYYMINTGKFFKPLLYFSPEISTVISNNKTQISELLLSNPNENKNVTLENVIPNLDIVSCFYAWFSIVMEMITALFVLWKPKKNFTHVLFILLILGIFITRLENGFMAILVISGIFLSDSVKLRMIYTTLAIVFISLIIAKVGFY